LEFWWGNPKERDNFEDLGLNDWMILDEIIKKEDGRVWTGITQLRT
jgi:hypothetical protein